MTEELKQAAQAALEQLEFLNACYPHKTAADAENALRAALSQQPATPEPVLFIHPDTFAMNNAQVGAWKPGHELTGYIPLYTHPAPSVPDDVARDAERGRFLIEWLKRYGLLQAEFGQMGAGEKPETWWILRAPWGIDKTRPFFGHGKTPEQAIDAAILAAK